MAPYINSVLTVSLPQIMCWGCGALYTKTFFFRLIARPSGHQTCEPLALHLCELTKMFPRIQPSL